MVHVMLPLQTHHNVRGPLNKIYNGEINFIVLLDREFVDLKSSLWTSDIDKALKHTREMVNESVARIVSIGNPLVTSCTLQLALKYFDEVQLIIYDTTSKQYRIWSFPDMVVLN